MVRHMTLHLSEAIGASAGTFLSVSVLNCNNYASPMSEKFVEPT